mmetsp:Transcript_52006/g.146554  ORF Transcript_52006/g.146554 Transcript_52006/m.146554 type:complete len:278 (+) Transcript_52006:171-1004(+)
MSQPSGNPFTNVVKHKGFIYATLDFAPPNGNAYGSQTDFRALPEGWMIAPNEKDIIEHVIAAHGWSAAVLAVNDGSTFHTLIWSPAGLLHKTNALICRGSLYKVGHNERILVRTHDNNTHLGGALWREKRFTDCVVLCGADHQPEAVHRAVLAQASPVFDRMLSLDTAEAKSRQIHVQDADPGAVRAMLQFAYTGQLVATEEDMAALMSLAEYYQMESLVAACATHALQNLTCETVTSTIRAFRLLKDNPDTRDMWEQMIATLSQDKELLSVAFADL